MIELKRYVLTEHRIIDTTVDKVILTKSVGSNDEVSFIVSVEGKTFDEKNTLIETANTIGELLKDGWLVESKSNVLGVVYDRGNFKEIVWCAGFATTRVEKVLFKGVKNIQAPTKSGYKVVWSNPTNKL